MAERFESMFGSELAFEPGDSAMDALTNAISDAIYSGFTRVLADSWWGRRFSGQDGRGDMDPENFVNPVDPFSGLDPSALGADGASGYYDADGNWVGESRADGGIANGPNSGYLAELHGTEAVVPLPDGRTIPVTLTADQVNAVVSPMARNQTEPMILNIDGIKNSIIDALSSVTTSPTIDTEKTSNVQTFAESLDNSRSLPELVNISRNMLGQMTASTQKLEQMIRAMEQNNTISRNAAYARA